MSVCYASTAVAGLGTQISALNGQVLAVQGQVSDVNRGVREVGALANATATRLEQLWGLFVDFVQRDKRDKALQLAETRLVKIRQEIEHLYGVRDVTRRRMIGLLQANDAQLVRKETSLLISEQAMIDAPRYWLAPALIGFSAWMVGDDVRCGEAFSEMMRRDPVKGRLFLALLFFRTGRDDEAHTWVEQYLAQQHPEALPRASIALIDAASNGLLPQTSCQAVLNKLSDWLEEMKGHENFDQEQVRIWVELLSSQKPVLGDNEFISLRSMAENWPQWQLALEWSRIQAVINHQFRTLFDTPAKADPEVKERIDTLLEFLINDFEEDESELRLDEMLNSAIVELEGERDYAMERIQAFRRARSERLSVGELLAVATTDNQANHASVATRKLATLMSRSWIATAIESLRTLRKENTPPTVNISIDGFSAEISRRNNESDITAALSAYYDNLENAEISRRRWTASNIGFVVGGVVMMFFGGAAIAIGLVLAGIGGFRMWQAASAVKAEFALRRRKSLALVEQAYKEISHLWQSIQNLDEIAADSITLLNTLDANVLKAESDMNLMPIRLPCLEALPTWTPTLTMSA